MDSPEGTLQVYGGYLFWGSKFSEIEELEKSPHLREPLGATPTAQIERWEMIVLWEWIALKVLSRFTVVI